MTGPRGLAAGALLTLGIAAPAAAALQAQSFERGQHWRFGTPQGVVHVWCPEGYDPRTAGTVVYVHGYFASADTAWSEDRLAAQFRESRQNALFIVPEAPSSGDDAVLWPSLGALRAAVRAETGLATPPGPLVVVGHSGAWRTLEHWLRERAISHLILLDALYGSTTPFRRWLGANHARAPQMVVVVADTQDRVQGLVHGLRGVVRISSVPESVSTFPRAARQARVLLVRSQYEHQAIVSDGRVIPVVLRLTSLGVSADASTHASVAVPRAPSRRAPPAGRSGHRSAARPVSGRP